MVWVSAAYRVPVASLWTTRHARSPSTVRLKEGDFLSLNGTTGCVYAGEIPTEAAELSGDFSELMDLCAKYARLQVRTNADTPQDALVAAKFGAVGIGLCRTEHMFFEAEKSSPCAK